MPSFLITCSADYLAIGLVWVNQSPPWTKWPPFLRYFKRIFLNEMLNFLKISLKFVPKGPIYNKSALVQVMAWRRTGAKPLPEPTLTQFTDACDTKGS